MSRRKTTQEFVEQAAKKHDGKYTYDRTDYTDDKAKVVITCPIHGDFKQIPSNHLRGATCLKCSYELRSEKTRDSKTDFVSKATITHGELYDYSGTEYVNSRIKVSIECRLHGTFYQTPHDHIQGAGCPVCNHVHWYSTLPSILYYVKVNGGEAYKVGITSKSLKSRFTSEELSRIEVLQVIEFDTGKEAFEAEQTILKEYKEFKYVGEDLLVSGNTELFSIDVLNLDKNKEVL